MKRLKSLTLFLTICLTTLAGPVGTWTAYSSYNEIEDIEVAGNEIFVAASGNMYSYNTNDGSLTTYSSVDKLSDISIKKMSWNSSLKRLVVAYENSNIDILSLNGDVVNVPDLHNKQTTGDKTIYAIKQYGQYAYLCTGFGIIKIDVKNGYVSDSYNLKERVNDVAFINNDIYIQVHEVGMKYASMSSNLSDPNSWKLYDTEDFLCVCNIDGKLVRYNNQDYIWVDVATHSRTAIAHFVNDFRKYCGDKVIGFKDNTVFVLDKSMNFTTYTTPLPFKAFAADTYGNYWAQDNEGKLTKYAVNGTEMKAASSGVMPDGPPSRYCYKICYNNGSLYSTTGGWSFSLGNMGNTAHVMQLHNDGSWSEFENTGAVVNACGRYTDINSVVVDPLDSKHAFVSGYNGLYEFYDGKFKKRWGTADGLQTYDNNPQKEYHVIITGLKFDTAGNLYMLNSNTDQPLFRLTKDGKMEHLATSTTLSKSTTGFDLDGITIDGNNVWFGNERNPIGGIYRYDISADQLYYTSSFTNQDGTPYSPGWVYCTAKDRSGNIWIGTNLGPFYMKPENTASWTFTQHKVPRNDGTNYADYLLTGIAVRCIAVDDANRKWIGTDDQGIFVISDDCNTQLYHFTSENSALISDRIYDITINEASGLVYISTENGLCSYQSEVTTTNDEMTKDNVWAYPNPVEPDYTGDITIVGLEFNSQVIITTASGDRVASGTSNGGSFTWNGCNEKGQRVASGVYMVHAAKSDGSRGIVTKIAIVR